SPELRSIALNRPYGGLTIGNPRTVRPAPPPSPPPSAATSAPRPRPPAGALSAGGAPRPVAFVSIRPPPALDPAPAVVRAPWAALPWTNARSFLLSGRGGTSPSWLTLFV